MRELSLQKYEPAFREDDFDGCVLRSLMAEDLRGLGIASVGHRRRLLDAVEALGTEDVVDSCRSEDRGRRRAPPAYRDVLRSVRFRRPCLAPSRTRSRIDA